MMIFRLDGHLHTHIISFFPRLLVGFSTCFALPAIELASSCWLPSCSWLLSESGCLLSVG